MPAISAALCVWRLPADASGVPEVLLVHPGGPFWVNKDAGAWSFPKGEYDPAAERGSAAAQREFAEELGCEAPVGTLTSLGETQLKSRKVVQAWAVEGDLDPREIQSNTFEIEWPPRSGMQRSFPEVDRAGWFSPSDAAQKLNPAQVVFVDRLLALLGVELGE